MLEKILESPLDSKDIQPVHLKGNQPWVFIGRTDAETPIFRPPDVKNWLIWKDPDAGKDWRWEKKGMTEDEMVRWHHRLKEQEFEYAPGSWWWTGRPGMLQSMGSQRVGHDWATELNWTEALSSCGAKSWLEQGETWQGTGPEADEALECEIMMWRMTLSSVDLTQIGIVAEETQCTWQFSEFWLGNWLNVDTYHQNGNKTREADFVGNTVNLILNMLILGKL